MKLASLWIGDRLGPIEILSAQSFLAAGNELTIFAYGPLADVPEGVEVRDAEPILSGEKILRYPGSGSPAVHANLFRYRMLSREDCIWVDLDIISRKLFQFSTPHVYGFEAPGVVNNAVLGLPPSSPALKTLNQLSLETVGYPTPVSMWEYTRIWVASRGKGWPIDRWPHASTGPRALTAAIKHSGEIGNAFDRVTFYPYHWQEVWRFVDPGALDPDAVPEDSFCVHLWGFHIRRRLNQLYRGRIPDKSYLALMADRLGPPKLYDRTPV